MFIGLRGVLVDDNAALPLEAGFAEALFGSVGKWTKSTGTLVLTVAAGQTVPNGATTTIKIKVRSVCTFDQLRECLTLSVRLQLVNSLQAQDSCVILASSIGTTPIRSTVVSLSLLLAPTAPAWDWITFNAKQSSTNKGAYNTLTFDLRPSLSQAAGDKLTISGLVNSLTADHAALPLGGAGAPLFTGGTGSWTQSTGTLVLTVAAGGVSNAAVTTISFVLINGLSVTAGSKAVGFCTGSMPIVPGTELFWVYVTSGQLVYQHQSGATTITHSTPITLGVWHHVAVTMSLAATVKLWVDGAASAGTSDTMLLPSSREQGNVTMGALAAAFTGDTQFGLRGVLDEVAWHRVELDAVAFAKRQITAMGCSGPGDTVGASPIN